MSGAADQRSGGSAKRRISEAAKRQITNYELRTTNRKQPFAILSLLLTATLLFFWPVWLRGYRFPIGGGDLWGQLHPVWAYIAAWLRRGVFPLWHTGLMIGDPIVAEGQYGLFNPINWPLFIFNPIPAWLISLRGMFSLWLAGTGMYVYLKRSPVYQLSRAAALTGALAYMFADPFIAHLGHPQFNDGMAWLPWTLWGVDCAARRARAIPWAGGALGLMLLAGHGQASLYGALAAGAYALWQVVDVRPSPEGNHKMAHRLGRLVLVGLIAAGIAAPGVLPGLERLPYTERALVPFDLRRGYEFRPAMLIDSLSPLFHGRGTLHFWPAWDRVESAYVGTVALYLAILGVLNNLRQRRVWFLIGLGTIAYIFALGYQAPLYPALARLPLFAESWKTARAIFLLSFTLAIGAALGVEVLCKSANQQIGKSADQWTQIALWGWLGGLIIGAVLLWFGAPMWATVAPRDYQKTAENGLRFAALLAGATAVCGLGTLIHSHYVFHTAKPSFRTSVAASSELGAERRGGKSMRPFDSLRSLRVTLYHLVKRSLRLCVRFLPIALPLLLLAELIALGARVEVEPAPTLAADPHAAATTYLRDDTGWFRVDVDAAARGLWSPAALQAAGFESPQGSGNPMELAAFSQFYWAVPYKGAPAYQLFSAKYIIVPKGALPGGDGIWPVYMDDPLVDVHLNTNAMNRVWLVYDTQPVHTIEQAYAIVFADNFAPLHTATVADGPDLDAPPAGGNGTLDVFAYGPNRATFGVHVNAPALFILSDIVYPGWTATLDGEPTPIYKTNGIFRGIVVPPGDHVVDMRFFPPSLKLGLGLAGMGGSIIIFVLWHTSVCLNRRAHFSLPQP